MAKQYDGEPVRTQDELHDAGRTVDAGRKGGAVSSAPYREEGPVAARAYDRTDEASEKSPLRRLIPFLMMAMVAAALIWAASSFRPQVSSTQDAPPAQGTAASGRDVSESRSDQSTPGLKATQ